MSDKISPKKPTPPARRHPPVFKTLQARIKFVVATGVLMIAVAALYCGSVLRQGSEIDAVAANGRYAATAAAPAIEAVNANAEALTAAGTAFVRGGSLIETCGQLLAAAAQKAPTFSNIGIASADGAVLCNVKGAAGPKNVTAAAFFARAVRSGLSSIGDISETGQGQELGFAVPIHDVTRKLAAVAFGAMPADALVSMMRASDGYVAGIADSRGYAIARESAAAPAVINRSGAASALVTEILSKKNGSARLEDVRGTERYYSFNSTGDDFSGRLYFYAGGETGVVMAAVRAATFRTAIIFALLALVSWWFATVLGDIIISRRARRLAHAMQGVVSGENGPEILPYGFGELDGITSHFDKLATDLREARATLEQKVALRTSMLEFSKGMSELDKARTEALLASIGEGVVATDKEGKISFINDIAKAALWWNPATVVDTPLYTAFRLEDEKENVIDDEKKWPTAKVLEEGEKTVTPAPSKPFYFRRQDNSRFPVKLTISPLRLNSGIAGMLIVFDDITDEVNFDKRKSEFISIASHQLRSPATALKFMSDMMRAGELGELNEKQKDWMGKLYSASDLMLELVNELLNVSRLEAGLEMTRKAQDLGAFAEGILKETEPLLIAKKQKFAFAKKSASVPFDSLMIGEVMKNFISNASKYSPEGGTVTIAVEKTEDGAKFSVSDQGMGIPKSDHAKMFGKFFRAENAMKSAITGTGLGLYYCKTAIEKHGGSVGFDSEPGKGSTFWFTLPLQAPKKA